MGQVKYIDDNGKRPALDMHNEYAYLAPMMYFDVMELVDFFRSTVLMDNTFTAATENLLKRKEHLEHCVYRILDYYDFHTDQGNDVYVAFLNMKDSFIENVKAKIKLGETISSKEEPIFHAPIAF